MDRRGQGISINVVIIAAIALLVLVILSVMVIRSGGGINKGTNCEGLGGSCTAKGLYSARCDVDSGFFEDRGGFCPKNAVGDEQYCCRRLQ